MVPKVLWSEHAPPEVTGDPWQQYLTRELGLNFHGVHSAGSATIAHRFVQDAGATALLLRLSRDANDRYTLSLVSYGGDADIDEKSVESLRNRVQSVLSADRSPAALDARLDLRRANTLPTHAEAARPESPPPASRDVVDNALRAHTRLSLRAEAHGAFRALFVGQDRLDTLDTPDWQVIFGRRGTGKTMLLGSVRDQFAVGSNISRRLPLLVRAGDAVFAAPFGLTLDGEQRALLYFDVLLEIVADELTSVVERHDGARAQVHFRFGTARRKRAREVVSEFAALSRTRAPASGWDTGKRAAACGHGPTLAAVTTPFASARLQLDRTHG